MTNSVRFVPVAAILLLLAVGGPCEGQWSFTALGTLGGDGSAAWALSADGSVVVGISFPIDQRARAFRWEDGVMLQLSDNPNGRSWAYGVSADGSVVVGRSSSALAGLWKDGAEVDLSRGRAYDVSADGSVVAGDALIVVEDWPMVLEWRAARWEWEDTRRRLLGTLGGAESHALGISGDGSVVVGWSETANGRREAFRWQGSMVGLGSLGSGWSAAYAISADGATIVGGSSRIDGQSESFRWEDGVMVGLGTLPGEWTYNKAEGVSGDGSVIVGWFANASQLAYEYEPFIWDATHGMRSLEDVLTDGGLDLSGWELKYAKDISDDGRVIVGYGTNPAGYMEAWRAVIPEPSTPAVLITLAAALALFHTLRRKRT